MIKSSLSTFAEAISRLGLTEVGYAIALLWYFDVREGKAELRPAFLAQLIHDLSLRPRVNVTRLGRQLLANRDVMRGREMGTVKLRVASRLRLSSHYNEIAGTAVTFKTDSDIIPARLFKDTQPHLETLAMQINGTYRHGFYDACAVMCRRLLECLLLLAFERAAKGEVIRDASGEYRAFADIVRLASSNRHIKLARGAGAVMARIGYLGDLAAHHPIYTTRRKDIDEQRLGFGRVISGLARLVETKPKGADGKSSEPSSAVAGSACEAGTH